MKSNFEQMTLTERHILTGAPDDCKECPVARVLQENGYPDAEISTHEIRLEGKSRIYQMGTLLHNWIANYDVHFRVPPIRLTICHYLKTIDITGYPNGYKEKK